MAADLGQWVPGLKLTPFLSERVEYETNVFQVASRSQSDVIFRTMPGFFADYTAGPYSLNAGYRAEILNYTTLTSQDTTNHIFSGQFRGDFARTTLSLRDEFRKTSDPPSSELTGPIESITNVLTPSAEYRLSPTFSLGLTPSWLHQTFPSDSFTEDLIGRDEYSIRSSVFWKFLPKTDLSLNYTYGWTTFIDATDRDYTYNAVTLGLRGDLTAKLSSSFRLGYAHQNADSSGQVAYSGWIMGGDWTYRPTERTTLVLSTLRTWQASTDGLNPYYVTTSAFLTGSHQLRPKVTLSARLGVGVNDYPLKDTVNGKTDWRQDTFSAAGANIAYAIQPWLRLELDYFRTGRDSNFSTFNFVDERISGLITVQY